MRFATALTVIALAAFSSGRAAADCTVDGGVHAALPANAAAGACYARINEPAVLASVTEKVLVKPATERVEVVPARYATINETVLVEPATTRVVNTPSYSEWIEDPVLVEPARKEWRTSDCSAVGAVRNGTGECACLITTPGRWETRRRLVTVAASSKVVEVPARYETVQRTVVASPVHEVRIAEPAEYATVTRDVQVSPERSGWTQVACSAGACSIDAESTARLERRLHDMGYETGPIDGIFDAQTRSALSDYQLAQGLVPGSCQDVAYLQRIP